MQLGFQGTADVFGPWAALSVVQGFPPRCYYDERRDAGLMWPPREPVNYATWCPGTADVFRPCATLSVV